MKQVKGPREYEQIFDFCVRRKVVGGPWVKESLRSNGMLEMRYDIRIKEERMKK